MGFTRPEEHHHKEPSLHHHQSTQIITNILKYLGKVFIKIIIQNLGYLILKLIIFGYLIIWKKSDLLPTAEGLAVLPQAHKFVFDATASLNLQKLQQHREPISSGMHATKQHKFSTFP